MILVGPVRRASVDSQENSAALVTQSSRRADKRDTF